MKKLLIIILSLCSWLSALRAQEIKIGDIVVDTSAVVLTDEYLDSIEVKKRTVINDYTLIGIHYGVGMDRISWNPTMRQKTVWSPINFGVTWTRYCKMFGYMPFFGLQAGIFYTREGYRLEEPYNVFGADRAIIDLVEVPVMAHGHADFWKMKVMVNIGFYGAYRLKIHREGEKVSQDIVNKFLSTERRFDYGIKAGGGFGFIFDPVEIHFMAMYKWGLGSLYQPDYNSDYYYRFASVSNLIFTVSLHFQITKRIGKTNSQLKREARDILNQQIAIPGNIPLE